MRDYIHVSDLADVHLLVLNALRRGVPSTSYNCGYGRGASVRDVVKSVERVIGRPLAVRVGSRRAGDPPILIADPARLKTELDWRPRYIDLDEIVRSALAWEGRLNT